MSVFAPHVAKRTIYVDVSHKTSLSAPEAYACLVLFIAETDEGAALRTLPAVEWPPLNQEMLRHVCKIVLFQLGHRHVADLTFALTKHKNTSPGSWPAGPRRVWWGLDEVTATRISDIRHWASQALVFERSGT